MPRRVMNALKGGETEKLTQNYWKLRASMLDKTCSEEEFYNVAKEVIPQFNDDELAYTYWELVYMRNKRQDIVEKIRLAKEYLLTEHMDRKYLRNNYAEVEEIG